MVRHAFEILKIRWPEVTLIVVLQAAMMLFIDELSMPEPDSAARMPGGAGFIIGMVSILYGIILTMLSLGFLKTAATAGAHPQQPMDLVRIGRVYFWKIIWFQVLFVCVMWILSAALFAALGALVWRTGDVTRIPDWFAEACGLAAFLLLIKPLLFVPARILVYDETALPAALAVRPYRLREVDRLGLLLAGGIGLLPVLSFMNSLVPPKTALYYVFSGALYLVFSTVFLWLSLTAVLWVQKEYENRRDAMKGMQA